MQNKPNLQKAQMNVNSLTTTKYRKNDAFAVQKTNPIQTQPKPISDYPCIFEWLLYNLVLRDDNIMRSMPNGRNFDGEYLKWQFENYKQGRF